MKIAVFGAGGIGGYLAGRLAESGEDIAIIARGEHLHAIRTNGLRVDSIKGDFVANPSIATDNPEDVGPVDVVILGVKAWQIADAAEALRPLIGDDTCVLPLQNGVEATSELTEILGESHVLGGLGGILSYIAGPGHIRHAGGEPFLKFGEIDNRSSPRTNNLLEAFQRAGIQAEIPSNIDSAIWEKFMFITAISGVGTLTRVPTGIWRSLPETWAMAVAIVKEAESVAIALDVPMSGNESDAVISLLQQLQPHGTVSMQRDIMEGRPSELEVQNGAIVRLGLTAGVPTPVNDFIYHSLLPQEKRARGEFEDIT